LPNELQIKLQVFESALFDAYKTVLLEEHVDWVSLHKVQKCTGLSLELFTIRLNQLWKLQFSEAGEQLLKCDFGLEVDATPLEHYRLRNKRIEVDETARMIIHMGLKKMEKF